MFKQRFFNAETAHYPLLVSGGHLFTENYFINNLEISQHHSARRDTFNFLLAGRRAAPFLRLEKRERENSDESIIPLFAVIYRNRELCCNDLINKQAFMICFAPTKLSRSMGVACLRPV